ncbi:MAG: PKD domain-containing protein [Cyclobacteriaceae bacterium]|nr:PKD domain-containing protein [Cyclobacteriaceae bacterium]
MQKMYNKLILRAGALFVLGAITLAVVSCKDDEDEAKVNKPDFEAAVATTYKITTPTGIPVTFTDKSENVSAYSWDFGDGSDPSTDAAPVHVYSLPGTYTVELTTASATGATPATAKKSLEVVVTDPTLSLPNLLQGGDLEAADEAKWTKIYSGQKAGGVLTHVKGTFGSTTNKPTAGVGGGFNATVPDGIIAGGEAGSIYYQAVTLAAGTYKFSGNIKHGAETPTGDGRQFRSYWFELYLGKEVPANEDGYNHDATAGLTGFIFSGWLGASIPDYAKPWPATDGYLPQATWWVQNPVVDGVRLKPRKAATIADSNGVVTLTAGTYYFVFKMGFGGDGGFGPNGITIDNLRLVKLN